VKNALVLVRILNQHRSLWSATGLVWWKTGHQYHVTDWLHVWYCEVTTRLIL